MLKRKSLFIFLIAVLSIFPLSAFSSRKKVKNAEVTLTDEELQQIRDDALAEIETRRLQQEENERLEKERQEKERLEAEEAQAKENERLAKEKAAREEELRKQEEARLAKEKAEQERLEKERLEAEKIENERKLEEIAANRYKKEYLSDYIVPEQPQISDEEEVLYEPIPNPDETDAAGCTLLMRAAKTGNNWQMKRLLEAGAKTDLTDNDGWTALMYAVRYNEGTECVEMLLNAGASIKTQNNFGSSVLTMAACYNNNPEILSMILNEYKSSDKEVLKAFVIMLSEQNISEAALLSKIKKFIEASVPLNSHFEGKTPLMYAAQFGNSNQALKLLMDNDASVTIRSTEGKTAFDYAQENKNLAHDEYYWALNNKQVR